MQTLKPHSLPLDRHALIEASAGTGKTYTITTLYLRAVLGLISEQSSQSLAVDEILVVTFTEAATEELKSRIRGRLKEAQGAILKWLNTPTGKQVKDVDPTVLEIIELAYQQQLVNSVEHSSTDLSEKDRDTALALYHKIQQNITLIDEASIFTIHGFCQRVLNQFAFETQMSFEQSFDLDNAPYLNHALQDFWRSYMSGLKGFEYYQVSSLWKSPEQLKSELQQLIDKPITISPALSDDEYQKIKRFYYESLLKLWQQLQDSDIVDVVAGAALKKSSPQNKHLALLTEFISRPFGEVLPTADVIDAYTSDSLADQSNYLAKKPAVSHPTSTAFDACVDYCKRFESPEVKGYWLVLAKHEIEQGAQAVKNEQQTLTPDDLLLRLQDAVKSEDNQSLIEAIQRRYPLAFIDEFQDTDPIQYEIFKSIYQNECLSNEFQTSENVPHSHRPTMIMIGDPKQAIYKFRGADINTYITAKTDLDETQHFTLDKNWRSHPQLIRAINNMYLNSEYQFGHDAIPFVAVGAGQPDTNRLFNTHRQTNKTGADPLPVLKIQHLAVCELDENKSVIEDAKGLSFSEAKLPLAKLCAANIKNQLQLSQQASLKLGDITQGTGRNIEGKDIAVLVRSRYQAKLIKQALRDLGVDSVYLSRDSVFDSALARDMLRLLEAINSPSNEKRVRAAVSTLFFSYLPEYQLAVQNDERQWHRVLAAFYRAHELWEAGKVTSAIQTILNWAGTLRVWQQSDFDFERLVTDLRHLEQLIQEQSAKLAGHEKLLVWYRQSVTEIERNDALSLRLESDRNLVQIVTMHGSKGLEYPIVYLPFVTEFSKEKVPLFFDEQAGQLVYRADKRQIDLQKAEKERLDEDTRLLYVAMTRAKYQLNLSTFTTLERSNSKDSSVHESAFGLMVLGKGLSKVTDGQWISALSAYVEKVGQLESCSELCSEVEWQVLTQQDVWSIYQDAKVSPYQVSENNDALSVGEFNGRIDKRWSVLSFSAIAHNSEQDHVQSSYQAESSPPTGEVWLAGVSDEAVVTSQNHHFDGTLEAQAYRFRFPKGANAGSCLHFIYEFLDFTLPVIEQVEIVEKAIAKFGLSEIDIDLLCDWLQSTLDAPVFAPVSLDQQNWCLRLLNNRDRLDEMEFYFSFEQLTTDIVSNALRLAGFKHLNYNNVLLAGDGLKGRLKGFVDLTCRINGQYYVMDYKSNYLGDQLSDYGLEQIQNSMTDHNYYLQMLIYTYALHRFLKVRIKDYDYQSHVGGGVYLYLRGMTNDKTVNSNTNHSESSFVNGVYSHKVNQEAIDYLDNALLNLGQQSSLESTNG